MLYADLSHFMQFEYQHSGGHAQRFLGQPRAFKGHSFDDISRLDDKAT